MTREEKVNRIRHYLREAYDARLSYLKLEANRAESRTMELRKDIKQIEIKKDNVDHNLGRATDSDLNSYHFLFFGIESPHDG